MIIPIRCVTCGKVLADKWRFYSRKVEEAEVSGKADPGFRARLLDELGLTRYCCRRHMLSHVDLVDRI
jgi:DNA-directed RNA polymerase subunit N